MNEMVDRAARALFDADYPPNVGIAVRWDGTEDWKKNQYRSRVRAIIAAMRLPTEGMIFAGAEEIPDPINYDVTQMEAAFAAFTAMIDAALSE